MAEKFAYAGKDLEAMAFAQRYHEWILQSFRRYLGRRIVEVGAGTGSFSELLLSCSPELLVLVEPSREMFQLLEERLDRHEGSPKIQLHNASFIDVANQVKAETPDSILYVNVLEHIENDDEELAQVHETLPANGRVFIFVPAFQWLYGGFDERVGHFRRYTRAGLIKKCQEAKFNVLHSQYFDSTGVLPWWIKYRLFKSNALNVRDVRLYDRLVVPIARRLESVASPPIGKNLLLIAEKS